MNTHCPMGSETAQHLHDMRVSRTGGRRMQHRALKFTRAPTTWIGLSILVAACGSSNGRGAAPTADGGGGPQIGQPASNAQSNGDASPAAPGSQMLPSTGGSSSGAPSGSGGGAGSGAGRQDAEQQTAKSPPPSEAGAMTQNESASSTPSTGTLPP